MKRQFPRIEQLPPYVFHVLQEMKAQARGHGQDIIDLGMGNPDLATPRHVVEKLNEAVLQARNHRYSSSKGIPKLRLAIADWYLRNYNVAIDPDTEAIATLGAKEGLAHLVLAILSPGDAVVVPSPTYPIHRYSVVIGGGEPCPISLVAGGDFFSHLEQLWAERPVPPKLIIVGYPHNPTTTCVDLEFFTRLVAFARAKSVYVIHDFAYADLVFDGYRAPSILEVPGAKDVAVELYSLSKGYSMAGWRVGFVCGNRDLVAALTRMKSYLDYGIFQPVQIASIIALNGDPACVREAVSIYQERRDVLVEALNDAGWKMDKPKGTMFVWAAIPSEFRALGSLEFSKRLLDEAKVVVSPGIGFGEEGEGFVRFALVENADRLRQAVRGIKRFLQKGNP